MIWVALLFLVAGIVQVLAFCIASYALHQAREISWAANRTAEALEAAMGRQSEARTRRHS